MMDSKGSPAASDNVNGNWYVTYICFMVGLRIPNTNTLMIFSLIWRLFGIDNFATGTLSPTPKVIP